MDDMPATRSKPINLRATRRTGAKEVRIFGQKDPRGPDNNLYVWIDEEGRLRIRLLKTNRCYQFERMIDSPSHVEIIAR